MAQSLRNDYKFGLIPKISNTPLLVALRPEIGSREPPLRLLSVIPSNLLFVRLLETHKTINRKNDKLSTFSWNFEKVFSVFLVAWLIISLITSECGCPSKDAPAPRASTAWAAKCYLGIWCSKFCSVDPRAIGFPNAYEALGPASNNALMKYAKRKMDESNTRSWPCSHWVPVAVLHCLF